MHNKNSAAYLAWIERNCFTCTALNARITPQTCAGMRARPLLTEGKGNDGQRETLFRPAGCGEDCAAWLAQRDAPRQGPTNSAARTKRGTCGFCGRNDLALISGGLCGGCQNMRKTGELVRAGAVWRLASAVKAGPSPDAAAPAPLTLAGADPDEQLLTPAELDAMQAARGQLQIARASAVTKGSKERRADAPSSAAAVAASAKPSGPAASSSTAEPEGIRTMGLPDDLPDDFEAFRPQPGKREDRPPTITIGKSRDIVLGVAAVRAFGLAEVRFVRLFWSSRRRALAIQPVESREGAYSLLRRKSCDIREICAGGFLRHFGIQAASRTPYPIIRGPGGLLVATIDTPAQPGGEA
jgi:hypothetical protein